jgi:hypothetical protein
LLARAILPAALVARLGQSFLFHEVRNGVTYPPLTKITSKGAFLKKLISCLNDVCFIVLNLGISLSRAIFGLSLTTGITYQQVTNSSCGLGNAATFLAA